MCGIIGYVGSKKVVPILLEGLKKLEYRGYDSAGIAVIDEGKIQRRRVKGKISELEKSLEETPLTGHFGIGHTRWATHGRPSEENAHPHQDCTGSLVVVHNGIIENYLPLKNNLMEEGHTFQTETDTEVIAHLIEEELGRDVGVEEAIIRATRRLEGSYALAIVTSVDPGRIFCARKESPLVLGVSEDGTYCASDVPAMLPYTNNVLYMRNGEFAILDSDGLKLFRISDGSEVERGLEQRLGGLMAQTFQKVGGVEAVAEMLNLTDRATEKGIMEALESEDPDLVEQIRRLMFVFEDIMLVNDKGIQAVLKEIDTDELALALRTASDELKDKIFRNMSERAAQLLKEDMEYMGPVRVSDVEAAQQRIVDVVRRLEDAGEIIIAGRGGEKEMVV